MKVSFKLKARDEKQLKSKNGLARSNMKCWDNPETSVRSIFRSTSYNILDQLNVSVNITKSR